MVQSLNQENEKRKGRLHAHFRKICSEGFPTERNRKLFLEAVWNERDPVECAQTLISSPHGLPALHSALCSDTSLDVLNTSAASFLKYIQSPDLATVCQGEPLRSILQAITEPSYFWDDFLDAQKAERLGQEATQCFSWLLLQLISFPGNMARSSDYRDIAKDNRIQQLLLQSPWHDVRVLGQRIKHTISTITVPTQFQDDGPGGRHDNDFMDIREISILPTPDEIESKEAAYIRRVTEIYDSPESTRLAMHLDNQFRLLREDMLRDLREELQIAQGKKQGRRKGVHINGLAIDWYDCNERRPWALRLKCTNDIPQFYRKSPDERKKYLSEHRNYLKHQSLACIITDGRLTTLATIHRDEDLLAGKIPTLCVQLSGGEESITRALLALRAASDVQLIQLNTATFAYEPVLRQLQNTKRLCLTDEIMLWTPEKKSETAPISEISTTVNLIAKLQVQSSCELQQLLKLRKSTKLDASQAKCLCEGLTKRLSIIQGPPGTGKSFLGALIAKAIHRFSASEKILVVCYTNHALDQFLEDLMKVGISSGDIVRLGSPTKSSTATMPLVLSSQQSSFRPKRDYYEMIDRRKKDLAEKQNRLHKAFKDYSAPKVSKLDIMQHLEFESDDFEFDDALTIPQQTDGMIKIGRKGKAVDQFYLLDRWANKKDAGVYGSIATKFPEVWQMEPEERSKHLARWKSSIMKERVSRLYECGRQYERTRASVDALFSEKDRNIIFEKRVIGCTTTAAAKYVEILQSASPGVLLVEEAGEILESHVLTALGETTKQLILIGDHKQLRPKAHHDLSVEKGDGYDLNRSLFERLILRGYPHQVLSQQHRMRPEISSLVRRLTYPDLTDAPSTKSRPNLKGFQDNIVFLNHDQPENEVSDVAELKDDNSTSSKQNDFEAKMTLRCVRYLGQQGYGSDKIVVLTPYVAQLRLLFDVLAKENDPVLNDLDSYDLVRAGLMPQATANLQKQKLRISTIDNYQGEECDIVVISLTRCNNGGNIGFLSSPERLNVLLSRARNALIMIGSSKTFLGSRRGKGLWSKFFDLLAEGSHVYDGFPVKCERHEDRKLMLHRPEDFDQCADGGCSEPCNVTLACGLHKCPQRCHQLFDHSKTPCDSVVKSKCPIGHGLSWKCRTGKPASCRICDNAKKAKEKKIQEEFARQQKRDLELQENADKINKIDEEIKKIKEAEADDQRSKEMAHSLEQKKQDLETAKRLANRPSASRPDAEVANRTDNDAVVSPSKVEPTVEPEAKDEPVPPESGPSEKVAPSPSEAEWDRQKRVENASNDAIDSLMRLTGLEEVKAQVLKIKARIDTALRQNTNIKDERYGVVLLGNPGTGKTTVARLYAKFLALTGVLTGTEFVETSGSRLANDGVAGAKKHLETILNAGGGAFFLDEAYQLALGHNYGGAAVLDFLLAEIENQVGKIVFILAGYNKQMEKFFEHNQGFNSRMPYRLQFADYSDGELLQMLGQRIKNKYNGQMKVEGGPAGLYARIAVRRLGRGRGRESFGNARALENLLARTAERQADRLQRERVAGAKPDDFVFKKEDFIGPEPSEAVIKSAAWKELNGLIGLQAVKDAIKSFSDRIHTNYQRELQEKEIIEVGLNRVFLGSPGTGKTSVGKLYGQILSTMGLLSNGEVIVKNPADFVGAALGESEKNTKAILKAAEGKVLIIDEAYMLHSNGGAPGSTSDPYKTAVVDTIVAEVQSTPGDDRCVLLLGYKDQMEEMFQNTNPGLSRRFPLDDAFSFEDFNDDQLRKILDLKLKKQGLDATPQAKDVAISILARSRQRPNFGNAGEVENIISHTKGSYQTRQSQKPPSERSFDVVFEPQDFDANFDRGASASVNCRELFKGVLGCGDVVDKLEGFVKTSINMKKLGKDPREYIPFNFIFKGPPGTGKTTTARKMGQVFYDMSFLSSPEVHECSATDLIGSFVGQTGPKTIKLLEKALGKVLFIDEAYRLKTGTYATEAVDELVDSLTKPRFAGKIVVILAGYEEDMNELLATNKGLSSRFSEEIVFTNMAPGDSWKLLQNELQRAGVAVEESEEDKSSTDCIFSLFQDLSGLPSWGNGRDVKTISKSIISSMFRNTSNSSTQLSVSLCQISDSLSTFLAERTKRLVTDRPELGLSEQSREATQELFKRVEIADMVQTTRLTPKEVHQPTDPAETVGDSTNILQTSEKRDAGVTDAIWSQLQANKVAEEQIRRSMAEKVAAAENEDRLAREKEAKLAKEVELLAIEKERNAELDEFKRRHEEARLKHLAAQRAHEEAIERLRKAREEAERKRREEARMQAKLRDMGVCVAGYRWIKQSDGYLCAGGSHFVSNSSLEKF